MKNDRFVRIVMVLLPCFFFFSGLPAAGQQTVHLRFDEQYCHHVSDKNECHP